jgi:hypothetical protein
MSPPSQFLREIPPDCLERTLEYDAPSHMTPRRALRPSFGRADDYGDDGFSQASPDFDEGMARTSGFGAARGSAEPEIGHEPRIEYDLEEGGTPLQVGKRVQHPQLGRGRIEAVTPWQGTVSVRFDSGERRSIKVKFLRLLAELS